MEVCSIHGEAARRFRRFRSTVRYMRRNSSLAVIFSHMYMTVRQILAVLVPLVRRDVSGEAELLALRHENAVLRRNVS